MTKENPIYLGVNIDHVATLRQARGTAYPRPAEAARSAERAGADSITVHLREDRRHIQDHDLDEINAVMRTHMNFEMAVTDEMVAIAKHIKPTDVCLVPEKREELTTEGGLDVAGQLDKVRAACKELGAAGIRVSLFIDPDREQLQAAKDVGAPVVELHTGAYADAEGIGQEAEFERLRTACIYGHGLELQINAGHGLHLDNVQAVARLPYMTELNIGHSIVARAVFVGLEKAVGEMRQAILSA